MTARLNIKKIYLKGQAKADEAYNVRNIGREDDLRGGNAGARIFSVKTNKYKSIGKCPRTSLLRNLGIDDVKDFSTKLMFDGGFGSEDYLMDKLAHGHDGKFIPEGEMVCEWTLPTGRKVTGTPDGILADDDGNPVEGIEAKCMSSGYTVIATCLKKQPRVQHLIQSAHYSMTLDIPFQLVYVSRVNYEIGGHMYNLVRGHERAWFGYNKDMSVKHMAPTMSVFLLKWDEEGRLFYRHSSIKEWTRTFVTKASITEYYRHVDECISNGIIPDKITAKSATNTYTYSECDYCGFKSACKAYGKASYEEWLEACKELSSN